MQNEKTHTLLKTVTFIGAAAGLAGLLWWNHGHATETQAPLSSALIEQREQPATKLVVFTMVGCPHCTTMKKTLAELEKGGELENVVVEVVECAPHSKQKAHRRAQLRAEMAGVSGFPTLFVYVDNRKVSTVIGARPKDHVLSILHEVKEPQNTPAA